MSHEGFLDFHQPDPAVESSLPDGFEPDAYGLSDGGDGFEFRSEPVPGLYDTDGDGAVDAYDMDDDGQPDLFDTNGDTVPDTFRQMLDADGDGSTDGWTDTTLVDSDGDGMADMVTETTMLDSDGDSVLDTVLIHVPGGFADDAGYPVPNPATDGNDIVPESVPVTDGLPDSDPIVGEPEEDMQHWEFQGATNRCAVFSQMFAIEELLDIDIDPDELTSIAEANGWYNDGTPPACMGKLMEYYGLKTEMGSGSVDDIKECLAEGGKVIVGLDSSEIWYGPDGEGMFSPGMQADHAVEVIGIDETDPENPIVILNDSGTPDGAGSRIPMEQFRDAWQDSGNLMVEAYVA